MSARAPVDPSAFVEPAEGHGAVPPAGSSAGLTLKPLEIEVPDSIEHFTLGRRIGSGTCGVVHVALDTKLHREVAIKLSPTGPQDDAVSKVPQAQQAFATEQVAAGRLKHPGIVTVYQAGQEAGLNYLVMEYVQGCTLKAYGKGQDSLAASDCLSIMVASCRALEHAHKRNILHRDIKPANIMLSDEGEVKLLDFGIAIGLDDETGLPSNGPTLGTPNYMSPEQILSRDLGPASDLYSLTTILFELLTGQQLFKAAKVKELFRHVVRQVPPRISEFRPDLPLSLSRVVARALSKEPGLRYQSGSEMADALLPYIEPLQFLEDRSPTLIRRMQYWQQIQAFGNFTDFELVQLLRQATAHRYAPGESLKAGRDDERRLVVIVEGLAEFATLRGAVKRWPVRIGVGAIHSSGRLLPGRAPPQALRALTPITTLELAGDLYDLLPGPLRALCQSHRDATFAPPEQASADGQYWPVDISVS